MKKIVIAFSVFVFMLIALGALTNNASAIINLPTEGSVISSVHFGDPDVYIVNERQYKRLFLNPRIFDFYGHIEWKSIQSVTPGVRDVFTTSGLFRLYGDDKVYCVEVRGEDMGVLHWVNTTGDKAVQDDPDFFEKVFVINRNEFEWYSKGVNYSSPNDCSDYSRGMPSSPTPTPDVEEIIRGVGEQEGSFLIQKINADSVEGLWYEKYPVSTGLGIPRTLRMRDDIGYACEGVSEKLTNIDFSGQKITFIKSVEPPPSGGCPICLADNTLIDTPSGLVLVKDLQIDIPIWTTDKSGQRVSGFVTKISKVPVPPTHQMVHLVLDDGRELFVSPGHPTIDGRIAGELTANDLYDDARVATVNRVTYDGTATYDVLPSGETGFYWANGILLDSTLH